MRIVLQRVSSASVTVNGARVGAIGGGLCLLVGVAPGDDHRDVDAAVDKILGLRVFGDADGKMNRSLLETGGQVLVVSQFTLLSDVRKGRRPSFTHAATPDHALPLIDRMVERMRDRGVVTANGEFGAAMEVELTNDGPVTLVLEVSDGIVG
jgi:D-tyrosyl-tRNA(Tyr) deacylase